MRYQEKTFKVPYMSKEYRDNWESVFIEDNLQVGDLVVVKEIGGYYCDEKWIEDDELYWFGIVKEIRKVGDVPHAGDSEECIKVNMFSQEDTYMSWSWEKRKNIRILIHNIEEKIRKEFNNDAGKEKIFGQDKPK